MPGSDAANGMVRRLLGTRLLSLPSLFILLPAFAASWWLLSQPYSLLLPFLALSVLLNPPLILGFLLALYQQRFFRTCSVGPFDVDSHGTRQSSLGQLSRLKKLTDLFAKWSPNSVFVAHRLMSFFLLYTGPSIVPNPTGSAAADYAHAHVAVVAAAVRKVCTYVRECEGSPPRAQVEALDLFCGILPRGTSSDRIVDVIMCTHNDGLGFLSTLFTLYDTTFYMSLPSNGRVPIDKVLDSESMVHLRDLGWLSHRVFEYILVAACTGLSPETVERIASAHISEFVTAMHRSDMSEKELEELKYCMRARLRRRTPCQK